MEAALRHSPQPFNTAVKAVAGKAQKPTILFVDDEERILRTLKMLFTATYNVLTTSDGNEAINILKSQKIHVLVSDQRMPIMMGVELLRLAHIASPNTMRLLLTGYSDLEAIIGSINEGEVFRYINKPWNQQEIRATLAEAVQIAMTLDTVIMPRELPANEAVEKILLIDEDPISASKVKNIINSRWPNHTVEWAMSLDGVFDILNRTEIALVVSESHLSNTDITDLIKILKQHNPNTITILLTSFKDADMLAGLINKAQLFRFLPKPIRDHLLLRSIEAGLERYRTFKATPILMQRHKVEQHVEPEATKNPFSSRIVSFFKHLRKPV